MAESERERLLIKRSNWMNGCSRENLAAALCVGGLEDRSVINSFFLSPLQSRYICTGDPNEDVEVDFKVALKSCTAAPHVHGEIRWPPLHRSCWWCGSKAADVLLLLYSLLVCGLIQVKLANQQIPLTITTETLIVCCSYLLPHACSCLSIPVSAPVRLSFTPSVQEHTL